MVATPQPYKFSFSSEHSLEQKIWKVEKNGLLIIVEAENLNKEYETEYETL